MKIKTPFAYTRREPLKLRSACPRCDALMTVRLTDPQELNSDLIQVCWQCGWEQNIKED